MKSEAVPPLADVCALLETEVEGLSRKYRAAKRRTDKGATAALLAVKYQEVLRVLMRILWQKEQRKKLMELLLPNGNGRSRRSTDQRRLARLDQLIEITSFLTLDIKALYLWCYEILEVFGRPASALICPSSTVSHGCGIRLSRTLPDRKFSGVHCIRRAEYCRTARRNKLRFSFTLSY